MAQRVDVLAAQARNPLAGCLPPGQGAGATCSLDPVGPPERWSGVALLEHTDVLLPNTAELLALARRADL